MRSVNLILMKGYCGGKDSPSPRKVTAGKPVSKKLSPREQIELQFVQTLIQAPELISDIKAKFDYHDITNANFVKIAQLLWDASENGESVDIQHILNTCEDDYVRDFISHALIKNQDFFNHKERTEGCLNKLKGFMIQELEQRVRSTSQSSDDYESWLKELVELTNQRRAVIQKNRSDKTDNNTVAADNV